MAWDSIWEDVFSSRSFGMYPQEELIRFVARNFYSRERSEVKILEIGTGPGANVWFCAREGFQVYGVDGSETAVRQAVERLDDEIPGWQGEIKCGDFSKPLPWPEATFDAVIDSEAVCCNSHDDAVRSYAEARRVLKVGGKLFVRTFTDRCVGFGTGEKLGHNAFAVAEGPISGHGFCRFSSRSDLDELLEGFALDAIDILRMTVDGQSGAVGGALEEWLINASKAE